MKALALSRRSLLRGTAGLVATAAVAPAVASCTSDPPADADATTGSTAGPPAGTASTEAGSSSNAAGGVFAELDAKIEAGMQAYAIPGVAVGVWYQGEEYLKGYGVTSLDSPQPVTADTIFRIGSTTKTFTGTAAMRLVEAGKLDLDGTVRTYLPDFTTSDPSVGGDRHRPPVAEPHPRLARRRPGGLRPRRRRDRRVRGERRRPADGHPAR